MHQLAHSFALLVTQSKSSHGSSYPGPLIVFQHFQPPDVQEHNISICAWYCLVLHAPWCHNHWLPYVQRNTTAKNTNTGSQISPNRSPNPHLTGAGQTGRHLFVTATRFVTLHASDQVRACGDRGERARWTLWRSKYSRLGRRKARRFVSSR